jgi:hypothetical protein
MSSLAKRVVGQSPGSNHDGFAEASWLTPSLPLRAVKIELQALKGRAWGSGLSTPGSNHDGSSIKHRGWRQIYHRSSLGKRLVRHTAQALTTTRCGSTVVAGAECITVANLSATGCIKKP